MTNELEKQFFDTFGIEPYIEIGMVDYPQITDRILLELICIWNKACLYPEDDIAPINYKKVKETVLEYFVDIEVYKFTTYKHKIKHQVRTLFEEGNDGR